MSGFSSILGSIKNQANKAVGTIANKTVEQIQGAFGGIASGIPGISSVLTPATGPQSENPFYQVRIYQQDSATTIIGSMPEELSLGTQSQWDTPLQNGLLGMLPGGDKAASFARMFGVNPVSQAFTLQVWQGTSNADFDIDLVFFTINDPYTDVIKPILDLKKLVSPKAMPGGALQSPGPTLDEKVAKDLATASVRSTAVVVEKLFELGGSGLGSILKGTEYEKPQETTNDAQKSPAQSTSNQEGMLTIENLLTSGIKNNITITIGNFLHFRSVVIKDVSPSFDLSLLDRQTGLPPVVEVSVKFSPLFLPSVQDWELTFKGASGANSMSGNQRLATYGF